MSLTDEQIDAMTDEQMQALDLPEAVLERAARRRWLRMLDQMAPLTRGIAAHVPAIDEQGRSVCYHVRAKSRSHCVILAYHIDLTVDILFGGDSELAGCHIHGFHPGRLERCGCGKWEPATGMQILQTAERVERVRLEMGGRRLDS